MQTRHFINKVRISLYSIITYVDKNINCNPPESRTKYPKKRRNWQVRKEKERQKNKQIDHQTIRETNKRAERQTEKYKKACSIIQIQLKLLDKRTFEYCKLKIWVKSWNRSFVFYIIFCTKLYYSCSYAKKIGYTPEWVSDWVTKNHFIEELHF